MGTTANTAFVRWRALAPALACLLLVTPSAFAADTASEHAQLAALVRQLDMLDRLAEHSERLPRQDASRYHFDYARLREDIERVRSGIRDYLTPQRAQPRDPTTLIGDYRQEAEDAP